ncbi:PVC-type heme-binding CxxCH protein [Rhodohalobacter sp. 8-1]|uniref:PVC-type heme-binding CxxCH protein n=1 Tax=Rhodohalobacter sp. 8-1 TaxID=3131972 RepID=UPI0030EC8622
MIRSTLFQTSGALLFMLLFVVSCATQQSTSEPQQAPQSTDASSQMESATDDRSQLDILFLGDTGHHRPDIRVNDLTPYLAERGIYLHHTEHQSDLNLENLNKYDALMIYGNRTGLPKQQETDLLTYVNNGGGIIAIHSASASFNDSDAFVNLIGGAFKAHGSGTFSVEHQNPNHPVLQGVPEFESWDETYVHMKHNPDKEVLSVRVEGDHEEPWTWVRNQGDGRVFYTAWGHDERTWQKEGFKKLIERATRWTSGDWALDADFTPPTFTFGEGKLPYYPAGEPWGTVGEPITKIQNPLTPEESRDHVLVTPEFEVQLFASEDMVINPIDLDWDEKGRLWVTETVDYPNKFVEGRRGNDRIKILEDTDGDGKADKTTIFADSLNIPTSLVLHKDGVIISQAPDFIYISDTDGDDVADKQEVLFTGWGTFDTHAGPSNLRYGFDNQIWGTVGYSAFDGTVNGEQIRFSSGFYRFQPDGSSLEYVSNTTNNTWGLGFNEEGQVFGSTANRDVPLHSVVPNRFYNSVRGLGRNPRIRMIANSNLIYPLLDEVRQVDQHGRYTAGSGFHMYTARDFPETYWNKRAFVAAPTGHLLGEFIIEKDGSSYSAFNNRNMMASQDEWFSPIQSKVGPDGALWVLDWYNLVIQHNPTPEGYETGEGNAYLNDLRDRDHARIYRIVHKDADHSQDMNLDGATPDEMVEALTHDNMFWRLTSQRLLVERGEQDVVPALIELVENETVDELGLNPGALHALWTLHGIGALDGSNTEALAAAQAALYHPASAVKRAALMTLPRDETSLEHIMKADYLPNPMVPGNMDYSMPTQVTISADAHVRLAALLAVAEMPASEQVGQSVAEMISLESTANDQWMRDAAVAAAAKNDVSFFSHVMTQQISPRADSTHKANVSSSIQAVAGHYALGDSPEEHLPDFLMALEEADPVIGVGFLTGVAEQWPDDHSPSFSSNISSQLSQLRGKLSEDYDEALDLLSEKMGAPEVFGSR